MTTPETTLRVEDLRVTYRVRSPRGIGRRVAVDAVRDVSLTIARGETLALVGESGCGKSTTGRAILRVLTPAAGRIELLGQEIQGLSQRQLRPLRREMSMIFQDPRSSLNPRLTVRESIVEALAADECRAVGGADAEVRRALDLVGLPVAFLDRFPHELSGGQRQRVGIARAIVTRPALIVCDEPTASLDVSIQAQVLNVLKDIQDEYGVSYLYISHDLATVRFMADRVAVMYMGRIVEVAPSEMLAEGQQHPYSAALLHSVLEPTPGAELPEDVAGGEVPSLLDPPSGCAFHTRCRYAQERCVAETPALTHGPGGRSVACHFPLAVKEAPHAQA